MKNLFFIILFVLPFSLFSQDNASEGKHFLFTFPQNDVVQNNSGPVFLNFTVSSVTGAQIHINFPHTSTSLNYTIKPNEEVTFSRDYFGLQSDVEDLSDGVVSDKVFEITSDNYISVSVLSSKLFSSDSYLVYPVSEWGNNYIHNSLYHFTSRIDFQQITRSSGFTLISQANNTKIRVFLKGKGNGMTKTGRHKIGDTVDISLDKGQSYTLKTQSNRNNNFDLSGSLITSDKPVGVISFHERTFIPQESLDDGMNFLVEMMQPLAHWKNKYISVDFGRKYGDFFRVLPLKDNTLLTIDHYDDTGKFVSTEQKTINTGGGFYEYNNAYVYQYNSYKIEGIKGITIWKANAPILVTHYSYSQDWDKTAFGGNSGKFDPFMINLINDDQFTKAISFTVPNLQANRFNTNRINLIIKVDTLRDINEQLKSIKLDNSSIYLDYPSLFTNRVENTDYYWLRVDVTPGVHYINSNVRFAAFLYGYGETDAYGRQTALGKIPIKDTLLLTQSNYDCSSIDLTYQIKDYFGLDDNDGLESKSYKIKKVVIDYTYNSNLNYKISNDSLSFNFFGTIDNYYLPTVIYFSVTSETGKVFYDSLTYQMKNSISIRQSQNFSSKPGDISEFDIYLNEEADSLAYLNDYTLSIKYKRDWFNLEDIIIDGDSYLDNITEYAISDTIYSILNIKISRSSLTDGNYVKVFLQNLLNKDTVYTPEFSLYSKVDNNCYMGSVIDTLKTSVCFQNLRLVAFDDNAPISLQSNIVNANTDASISIYNYAGRCLINNYELQKDKELDLNEFALPVGPYWIVVNNYPNFSPLTYFHF